MKRKPKKLPDLCCFAFVVTCEKPYDHSGWCEGKTADRGTFSWNPIAMAGPENVRLEPAAPRRRKR